MNRSVSTALLCAALSFPAAADEADIRRVIGEKLRGSAIESVRPAPIAGWFEVVVRGDGGVRIFYTDRDATLLIVGNLIDVRADRDLTGERVLELSAIKWESLPLDWAFTVKHGSGRRKIAVFSDPNCPFCRRFEGDLAKMGDVTIYLFLYPIIKPDSVRQTKAVWCSRDRARAWMDLMFKGIEPAAAPDCDTPVEKIVALGRKLGAKATPTWVLPNGELGSGALPLEEIRRRLDAAVPDATGAKSKR